MKMTQESLIQTFSKAGTGKKILGKNNARFSTYVLKKVIGESVWIS